MLKAPVRQTAGDTISTLSSRLASATLLEDRRASILGLRSFAKQYPASVASGSLRDLIGCLRTDGLGLGREDGEGGDVDTVRLVLETLLMLFNPDQNSPEASEDIALWLADEFSQRQDNITILLDLLDQPDYYSRIYSIQLLTAISSSRPERTQECILQAPLGTARLVGVLDDTRDAVRNAALVLLVDLTTVSQTELQKLIAFEDAFQRTLNLIQAEGGLAEGGIVVQDCLAFLANLIKHSASNQSLFRETGCIPRLVEAVQQSVTVPVDENEFSRANREKNSWGLLAVLRLFLEKGEVGTKQNQDVFWRAGLVQMVLRLAFDIDAPPMIRTNALKTCADMIINNTPLQESFAALQVPLPVEPQPATNGTLKGNMTRAAYVIEALLDLVLVSFPMRPLELRASACALIKAYFAGHQRIKLHFLQRAIAGYTEGEDENTNILSTLMTGPQGPAATDPLRFALASDIASQLLYDEAEAKAMLMSVQEGDAEKGEDVVTATQMLSGHLLACLQNDFDPQVSIAYLVLLITFLFDDPQAINDCLAEGSSLVGVLITTTLLCGDSQVSADPLRSLLPGLCAMLLGTIYEFSTKDSPISRRTLHPLLLSKLGRPKYFEALTQFRSHPDIRDFELITQSGAPEAELISVLLDAAFVEWFKDEYGRLKRAIDRDPGIEVIRKSEVEVDRDILDDLREQIKTKDEKLQEMENATLSARRRADSTAAEQRREVQSLQSSQRGLEGELERIKRVNEALQRDHEAEMQRVQGELRSQIAQTRLEARTQNETMQQNHARELERLKGAQGASLASERSLWEDKARKAAEQAARELSLAVEKAASEQREALAKATEEHRLAMEQSKEESTKAIAELEAKLQQHEATIRQREDALQDHEKATKGLKQDHQTTRTAFDKLQSEYDEAKKMMEKLEKEVQQSKKLQDGLQEVNTKAMARVKALEEEGKQRESRIKSLTEDKDQYQAEKETLESKISDLEKDAEALKTELEAERKGYGELEAELEKAKLGSDKPKAELKEATDKLAKLEAEIKQAKVSQASAEADLKKAKNTQSKLEAHLKKAQQQQQQQQSTKNNSKGGSGGKADDSKKTAQLEKDLAAAKAEMDKEKEETKKARSELEDLLMVLADLEGKQETYRERLKKLGEEVSDDEDDDDDEDGDEDEDDEDDEDNEDVD